MGHKNRKTKIKAETKMDAKLSGGPFGRLMAIVRSKAFVPALFVVLSVVVLWPSANSTTVLPQGDMGRDLYSFERTAMGEVPYRDFFWNYGPLMPYYYAAFFKVLGVSVKSILVGKLILKGLSALAVFLTGNLLISPVFSLLAALWFLVFCPDFVHAFNHTGGLCVILWTVYGTIRYSQTRRLLWLGLMVAGVFVEALIKINMGLAVAVASGLSLLLVEWTSPAKEKVRRLALAAAGFALALGLAAGICAVMVQGVPAELVKQYFPVGSGYQQDPGHNAITTALGYIAWDWGNGLPPFACASSACSPWTYRLAVLFLLGSILAGTVFFFRRFWNGVRQISVGLAIVMIYVVLLTHEFILAPMFYSLWWICPLGVLLVFMALDRMAGMLPSFLRNTLVLFIAGVLAVGTGGLWQYQRQLVADHKTLSDMPKVGAYFNHSSEWRQTVIGTVAFLNGRLKPGEKFLALPYDVLYYYLTGRKAPVLECLFFKMCHIPLVEERRIIAGLEREKVNYILVSNRIVSNEGGLGVFGQTHCQELAKYIEDNFKPVASFGDWQKPAEWVEGHATMVYERKSESHQ